MKGIQLHKYVCLPTDDKKQRFEISGLCLDVAEAFTLLVCYAT